MEGNWLFAFGLTLFAGLSTGLGSLVVFFKKKPGLRLLSVGLGFSSGVMIFVSLVELLPQGAAEMSRGLGEGLGNWAAHGCFFAGILFSALIDRLVPEPSNPHEAVSQESLLRAAGQGPVTGEIKQASLARVGMMSALAIAIHNFPEGMATFVAGMTDASLGISIAVAVAIHNIPEGIAVAVPVYFATGQRGKAATQSFLSGLAEPLGALVVFALLSPWINATVVGALLALVGGVMVFISFDELLPTAREYSRGHEVIVGLVGGMAIMAVSLLLL